MAMRTRLLVVVFAGVLVGVLTSFGQAHLDGALNAFVNSASAWLVAPFFVGALMRTFPGAAAAGFATCALQLAAYTVTSELRGFGSPPNSLTLFWTICAILGGPIFGLAGCAWREGRGLGGAVLPAAFIAEGLCVYLHTLGYRSTAALWLGIGATLALVLCRPPAQLRWLAVTVPVGVAAEIMLSHVYGQTIT